MLISVCVFIVLRKKTIASRFSKAESEYKKKADKKKQKNEVNYVLLLVINSLFFA